ncbi:MAG: DUF4326 domain-containing protein [Actinomycetia bacterium]|nr:DUF4326 domain-containing protein [Actinomycetes bacterium]
MACCGRGQGVAAGGNATTVINLRDREAVAAVRRAGRLVRIDRATRWGNPFRIGRDGTRAEVIERYRAWILTQPELVAQLPSLRGKVLACWCAPQPCHGDVLAALADGAARVESPPLATTAGVGGVLPSS